MKRIDHIGIAVSDMREAEKIFSDVLGSGPTKTERVLDESVIVSFFQSGESLSLIHISEPTRPY